ncbi:ATP-binding protein [Streptomyces sp. NPDC006668]|uniref:ATP-binding protein n=1 Tax=Streptomyces sp. NPDC006668 TaxID=3156903 RepID=UPI0033D2FB7E
MRLTETGTEQGLGAEVQTTLYRIVQESLTNVVKHEREASRADVVMHFHPARVAFKISDDGRPVPGAWLTGPTPEGWVVSGELRPGAAG